MPAVSPAQPPPPGSPVGLLAELAAVRAALRDPDGRDPASSAPLGPEDDVVEMCAAVYAMPDPGPGAR